MRVRTRVAAAILIGASAGASSQETKSAAEGTEFRLTFAAAEGITFPFETNAEEGGGGCAPPKRHDLAVGPDGQTAIPLGGRPVAVVTDYNRITVDTNLDGKPDEVIKGTAGSVVVETSVDGETQRYGVRLFGDGNGRWTYDRWGTMTGKVQGTTLVLIDENANGVYNDVGKDRMVVGDGTQAYPLSTVVSLGGELYELQVDPSGARVRTRPYAGEVGKLDLASAFQSRGKLLSAVVRNGKQHFEVAGGTVNVPVGEYKLFSGVVAALPQLAHLKQGAMKSFLVEAGKTTTVEWGMPIEIQFAHEFKSGIVTIQPEQIHVRGGSGEEYFGFKPMAFTPTVVVRDMRSDAVVQKGTMVLG